MTRRRSILALCAAVPSAAATGRPAQAAAVAVLRDGSLSFTGHATVGDFVGTTSTVTGEVAADPDLASVRGWVEAPVATLRTGNGRRDRDLRAVMDAAAYPTIRFELAGAAARGPLGAAGVPALLRGTLRVHGVAREVSVPATVARVADTVRVAGGFPLDVSDYQVRGLSKMFGLLKMREVVDVRLALRFVVARPHPAPSTRSTP